MKLAVTVTQVHVQEQSLVIHLREHGRQALGVLARAAAYASRVKHKLVIVRERKLVLLPARGVHAASSLVPKLQNQQQAKPAATAALGHKPEQ